MPKLDWKSGKSFQPKGDDSVDCFEVPGTDPVSIAIVRTASAGTMSILKDTRTESFFRAVVDPNQPLASPTQQIYPGQQVWVSGEMAWAVNSMEPGPESLIKTATVFSAVRIADRPSNIAKLPSGRRIVVSKESGTLTLYDSKWAEISKHDLFSIVGTRDLDHAFPMSTLACSDGVRWFEPTETGNYDRVSVLERFEVVTPDGRHVEWTVRKGSGDKHDVRVEVLEGLYARHDIDRADPWQIPTSETTVRSPSGNYTLRIRRIDGRWGGDGEPFTQWTAALVSNQRTEDGSIVPIVVWEDMGYREMTSPQVSDGGLAVWFIIDRYENAKNPERSLGTTSVFVRNVDDHGQSYTLTRSTQDRELPYESVEQALADVYPSRTRINSTGTFYTVDVRSLKVKRNSVEEFNVYRKSGPPLEFVVHGGQVKWSVQR
jgi:hypothetical protein